jgi:polyphenol oxidase
MIRATALELPGISHGFFTREGGHSTGIFSSLNCGLGSGDDIEIVKKNRALVAKKLNVAPNHLVSAFQVHSADVMVVTAPLETRPKVDGLVTATPGLALGILTADCGPVLFADHHAGVVGACHAGWKGALGGVTDSIINAMEGLGAKRENMVAVLGPTISQTSYEVGPEFLMAFREANATNEKYFILSLKKGHYMFDLPAYLMNRLALAGVRRVQDLRLCTYTEEDLFFSYRRTTHRAEADYGRLISTVALKEK